MIRYIKNSIDASHKVFKKADALSDKILALDEQMSQLSDEELKAKTPEFKKRLKKGETLDDILVEAFAVVREASYRVLNMKPFKVQIIGGIILHGGNIAEMRTGEGKTLTSTMPAYLNALEGKGVHVITVNDYLASRDAREMGELFRWLGLTVGLNSQNLSQEAKKEAYACDITYSTNNEIGFDYLRDNMATSVERLCQRHPLNYAIIDEVDSALIDEARTPLIISGGQKDNENLYIHADMFAKSLTRDKDFEVDIQSRIVRLSDEGIKKAERGFQIENLYDACHGNLVHRINNALTANYIMAKDVDYVVQDDEIIIVDSFTGRLMHGRNYVNGLHQAIQAKENVSIKKETTTIATITFQNLFRLYRKLSGMTGTAKTEEEEFRNIYNMIVVEVPTNNPVARIDATDLLYKDLNSKYQAIIKEVKERHETGQPILLGTVAVETSEVISSLLSKENIPHNVLNAKNHEREAEIIMKAGEKGAVTIATNMAGRGTDIKLTDEVKALGGLAVIGTERHESRRIDNQLRGRSGRQGDPGYTRFYLSFEDELMVRFGSDRVKQTLDEMGIDNDLAIESKLLTRAVESAQKRVEGNNYDSRKTVLEYDDVVRIQREIVYSQRLEILTRDNIQKIIDDMMMESLTRLVDRFKNEKTETEEMNIENLVGFLNKHHFQNTPIQEALLKNRTSSEITEYIYDKISRLNTTRLERLGEEAYHLFLKNTTLQVIDKNWMNHIDAMSGLRQGIHLRSYAQVNPLLEYQSEGMEMFKELIDNIQDEVTLNMALAVVRVEFETIEEPVSEEN